MFGCVNSVLEQNHVDCSVCCRGLNRGCGKRNGIGDTVIHPPISDHIDRYASKKRYWRSKIRLRDGRYDTLRTLFVVNLPFILALGTHLVESWQRILSAMETNTDCSPTRGVKPFSLVWYGFLLFTPLMSFVFVKVEGRYNYQYRTSPLSLYKNLYPFQCSLIINLLYLLHLFSFLLVIQPLIAFGF